MLLNTKNKGWLKSYPYKLKLQMNSGPNFKIKLNSRNDISTFSEKFEACIRSPDWRNKELQGHSGFKTGLRILGFLIARPKN